MFFSRRSIKLFICFMLAINILCSMVASSFVTVGAYTSNQLYGDANADLSVDIEDVTLIQKHIAQMEFIPESLLEYADVDNNESIDIKDATLIQKLIVQLISYFPAESLPTYSSDISNGSYYLRLKGTNLYLSHQGAISNGTNVYLAQADNASDSAINIKIEAVNSNTYRLISPVNNDVGIGAFRSGAYTNPLVAGKNINLWEFTDSEAQYWQFTKTYDGYYIISLAALPEYSISARGKKVEDNIYLENFDPLDNLQKWELVEAQEYKKPEYPVTITGDVNVRSGPDTVCTSLGVFKKGQQVTAIGELHGGWYELRGVNSKNNKIITGYSYKNYVQSNIEPEIRGRALADVNVRAGAGTNYNSLGVFAKGIQVTVIGEPHNNWYKVRGTSNSTGKIISGYSYMDYISINDVIIDTDNPRPDFYSASYNKSKSPFAKSNLYGQCTWYAWGRANEVKGINVPCRGNAKTWYSVAKDAGYSVGSEPKKNSIAVWSSGNYGHVAYVERVDDELVTISESNWYRTTLDNQYSIESGIYYYSGYTTFTKTQMTTRYGTLLGYIYL